MPIHNDTLFKNRSRLLLPALFMLPFIHHFCFSEASAQGNCGTILAQADKKYSDGEFDKAIDLLNACLNKGSVTAADSAAIILLSKAYFAKNRNDLAEEKLKQLLKLVPNWRPNPINNPPDFQQFAEEAMKEIEKERLAQQVQRPKTPEPKPPRGGSKKWLLIGGGAIATGTIVYFLVIKDGGKEERLPDPPALPPRL